MWTASLLVLLHCAAGLASGSADLEVKDRPVTKVITLLKDMVTQLTKEGEEDEEVYDKMVCWCQTNDKEKTKSIAEGESRIGELNAAIEELTAGSSQLNAEIANLNKELAKNQEALATATALREKQLAEFNDDEKSKLEAITSLKSATVALSTGGHESALMQLPQTVTIPVLLAVKKQMFEHKALIDSAISPRQRRRLEAFVQAMEGSAAEGPKSYEPQSGEIFGVLKQMKETFETNLAAAQKEEAENQHAFENLKASKETQIADGEDVIATKTEELAVTDEKNAQSKQDLEDTEESKEADEKYLANLKEKCAASDAEYADRTKTRQLEITAVSKALEFLSGDEAHDIFARTLSLVQTRASDSANRRAVSRIIEEAAQRHADPRLSALALKVRLDKFTRVKETLQNMVDKLSQEKKDDVAHKDFCVKALNENSNAYGDKDKEKNVIVAKIEDLKSTMDTLAKAIEMLKVEVAESLVELKKMSEEREAANKDFQMTVADQRATQKLLMAALNVLKGFYEKAALVKVGARVSLKQPAGPPPPPGFKAYENNAASGGVMGMMQGIIDDAKTLEKEATRAEEEQQVAYETFVKTTNKEVAEKERDITHKTKQKAKAEEDKVESEEARDDALATLEQLMGEAADFHRSCDFLLKNFDVRMAARDEEITALTEGIAMFSGASFSSLMQHWR